MLNEVYPSVLAGELGWSRLPGELVARIGHFLDTPDVLQASATCRDWREMATDAEGARIRIKQATGGRQPPSTTNHNALDNARTLWRQELEIASAQEAIKTTNSTFPLIASVSSFQSGSLAARKWLPKPAARYRLAGLQRTVYGGLSGVQFDFSRAFHHLRGISCYCDFWGSEIWISSQKLNRVQRFCQRPGEGYRTAMALSGSGRQIAVINNNGCMKVLNIEASSPPFSLTTSMEMRLADAPFGHRLSQLDRIDWSSDDEFLIVSGSRWARPAAVLVSLRASPARATFLGYSLSIWERRLPELQGAGGVRHTMSFAIMAGAKRVFGLSEEGILRVWHPLGEVDIGGRILSWPWEYERFDRMTLRDDGMALALCVAPGCPRASAGAKGVVWSLPNLGREGSRCMLRTEADRIVSLSFHPDLSMVIGACSDRWIRAWFFVAGETTSAPQLLFEESGCQWSRPEFISTTLSVDRAYFDLDGTRIATEGRETWSTKNLEGGQHEAAGSVPLRTEFFCQVRQVGILVADGRCWGWPNDGLA